MARLIFDQFVNKGATKAHTGTAFESVFQLSVKVETRSRKLFQCESEIRKTCSYFFPRQNVLNECELTGIIWTVL